MFDSISEKDSLVLLGEDAIDVLKALALGAKACMIGRPYLYGLAAAGQAGVSRVLEFFEAEICRDLALLGCRTPAEVSRDHIRRRSG